ncbi:hypothetical protein ACFQ3R_02265 [Mesonia ostreae]|uniref:Uncharacterized protein n=1 Tax=Mesonia ostreae TaxID=861110 RepID=A0ABU2KLH2_9FLAO|nr:hypothetical protein [Mesonia ostreae]MDT0295527.1 hypothetical protein [Mesonia ostreae]
MKLKIFFYPLLFLSFNYSFSQELHLFLFSESEKEQEVIDEINYKKNHTDINSIQITLTDFKQQLFKQGYIDAEIIKAENKTSKPTKSFRYKISLEKKYSYINIQLPEGFTEKSKSKLFEEANTTNVTRIPIIHLEEKINEINNFLANQGKPFTYSELTEISKENDSLFGKLQNTSSNIRSITKIEIKGYDKFPKNYTTHYLNLRKGQLFNKLKIDEKVDRLKDLSFSESTRNPEVLFQKDSTTVFLYLKKKNSNSFDGYLGFATTEESQKLELNGYLNLQLENNFNFGEKFSILYRNDGEQQLEFDANLELPYIFNTPLGIELNLNLFKRDSTYTNTQKSIKTNYQLNPKIEFSIGYLQEDSNKLQNDNIISSNEDFISNRFLLGAEFYVQRNPNSFFRRNSFFTTEIGIGSRKTDTKKEQQQIYCIRGAYQFIFHPRNAINLRNTSGFINSDSYLTNELLRIGGINSIRGFEENSINANLFSAFQLEYQYLLSSSIYAHTITDYAVIESPEIKNHKNLVSFGFGMGLKTKVGNLKLMFANGKTDDQKFDFSNTKVHIQLIARF